MKCGKSVWHRRWRRRQRRGMCTDAIEFAVPALHRHLHYNLSTLFPFTHRWGNEEQPQSGWTLIEMFKMLLLLSYGKIEPRAESEERRGKVINSCLFFVDCNTLSLSLFLLSFFLSGRCATPGSDSQVEAENEKKNENQVQDGNADEDEDETVTVTATSCTLQTHRQHSICSSSPFDNPMSSSNPINKSINVKIHLFAHLHTHSHRVMFKLICIKLITRYPPKDNSENKCTHLFGIRRHDTLSKSSKKIRFLLNSINI